MTDRFGRLRWAVRLALVIWAGQCPAWTRAQDGDSVHSVDDNRQLVTKGDLIIGGLFPVHDDGSSIGKHCGAIKKDKGVQRVEAMLYAVDRINKAQQLLPGITLGVQILDTCDQDTHGLEQTLEFIKTTITDNNNGDSYSCPGNVKPIYVPPKRVAAVIGAANSQVSAMVANVLRLFKMPQISYSSTSAELSDKTRFEYFSRVVPPDDMQAAAMVDVVEQLGWTFVSTVADEGNYGEQGTEQFRKLASKKNICLATNEKITRHYQENDFKDMLSRLEKARAHGVVMFVNENHVKTILALVTRLQIKDMFAFVASDSWGNKRTPIQFNPDAAVGTITIQPKFTVLEDFNTYFTGLNPVNNTRNIWFKEFWRLNFKCNPLDRKCASRSLAENHLQESYVPFVVDAINLLAVALNVTISQHCFGKPFNSCYLAEEGINGTELLHLIRNVTFFSAADGDPATLDQKGDRMSIYQIYQYRGRNDGYLKVGTWKNELLLNLTAVSEGYGSKFIPKSSCGEPCKRGNYRSMARDNCCWTCMECNETSIMPNDSTCIPCELGYLPNGAFKNECIPMVPQTMEWHTLWSIIPACFSAAGMISTLFVLGVFLKYSKTPVIRASGRELCYIMLVGIFLAYAVTFILLNPPDLFTCGAQRLGLGTTLCIIYASILTKTSRLSRIFTSNARAIQHPRFISPTAQVVICSVMISVQLFGAIIWLSVEPPHVTTIYPDRITAVLSCKATATPLLLSLTYILLLICLCTVYAFKTRKIPENFNETKHIGFTMYATCIIWLAFVPIYFGTINNFRVQTTSMCMCISISGTVALACFFAPKVYIVLFQPNKNVRASSNLSSFQKSQIGIAQQQMRFIRPKHDYESTMVLSHSSHSHLTPKKSCPSRNGDIQSEEPSAATSLFTGANHGTVNKRRRSSALKLMPYSDSRHHRVGALSVAESRTASSEESSVAQTTPGVGGGGCRERQRSKRRHGESRSSTPSLLKATASQAAIADSLTSSLEALVLGDEHSPFLTSRVRGRDASSGSLKNSVFSDVGAQRLQQQSSEEHDEDASSSSAPSRADNRRAVQIAWGFSDPRSEFEMILTEISDQEGTFV